MNGLWDDMYEYIHNFAGGAQTFSGCVYNQAAGNITSCSGTSVYVLCDVMVWYERSELKNSMEYISDIVLFENVCRSIK